MSNDNVVLGLISFLVFLGIFYILNKVSEKDKLEKEVARKRKIRENNNTRVRNSGTMPTRFIDLKKLKVRIEYISAANEYSVRDIAIFKVECNHIKAYCYLRRKQRTFKINSIQSLTDPKTGEVYSNSWIKRYLKGFC